MKWLLCLLLPSFCLSSGIYNPGSSSGGGGLPFPGGATNYIQNTNSLQSGATFYVSSGTVAGQLSITSLSNTVLAVDGSGVVISTTVSGGGGGGSPGGSSGQMQYNNAGSFAGDANSYVTSSSETFSGSGGVRIKNVLDIDTTTILTTNGNPLFYYDGVNKNMVIGNSLFPQSITFGAANSNYCFGDGACNGMTTGGGNTAIGLTALQHNQDGNSNVAIGLEALQANTSGITNVALGQFSLVANTDGFSNFGLGYSSLSSNVHGNNNVGIGYLSLRLATSSANTGIGGQSGYSLQSPFNIMIGFETGYNNSGGYGGNTFIGDQIGLYNATNTTACTIIGNSVATTNLQDGFQDILIGTGNGYVDTPGPHTSNFLNIGNTIFGTGIESNSTAVGNIGIGTNSPLSRLNVQADAAGSSWANSQITISGNTDSNKRLALGYDTTDNFGYIQAGDNNVAYEPLILNLGGGNIGIANSGPQTLLHMSSGTFTIDGNVSPAIKIKGSGAPPDSQALCLLGGSLGHCSSTVNSSGGCTCVSP